MPKVLSTIVKKYAERIKARKAAGQMSETRSLGLVDALLFFDGAVGTAGHIFKQALFIPGEEIRESAASSHHASSI